MTGNRTALTTLRPNRREFTRLGLALALSLVLHLTFWGVYVLGRNIHWPVWMQRLAQSPPVQAKQRQQSRPPLLFVDVTEAQAVTKEPKDATRYSDRNSVAANPELNKELNTTYLWFGSKDKRSRYAENQAAQDSNAFGSGGLSSRAVTKSGSLYNNVGRDLVDTYDEDKDAIAKLSDNEFPDELQKLSRAERLKRIEAMSKRRAEIKSKMAAVNKDRQAFIDNERAKVVQPSPSATLGDAFSEAAGKQLEKSGFELNK